MFAGVGKRMFFINTYVFLIWEEVVVERTEWWLVFFEFVESEASSDPPFSFTLQCISKVTCLL